MDWYTDFFRDERMREVDPFGYGMGLAIGYVIIPAMLLGLLVLFVWAWLHDRRSGGSVPTVPADPDSVPVRLSPGRFEPDTRRTP